MHESINSKLDCVYVVNILTQYHTNPSPSHIQITKRILCDIKGTFTLGITYQQLPNGDILHGFYDVDWARDKNTCRFTFDYYFILGRGGTNGCLKRKVFLKNQKNTFALCTDSERNRYTLVIS
jgi:hypothetical protein